MWIPTAHNRLARRGATSIFTAFDAYKREFQALTRQAKVRFETRDWHGLQRDSSQRLDLYSSAIARSVTEIRALLDNSDHDKKLWVTIKSAYVDLIRDREDIELAETFFNSVSRRIFTTIGVDRRIEFLFSELDASPEAVPHADFPPLSSRLAASRSD